MVLCLSFSFLPHFDKNLSFHFFFPLEESKIFPRIYIADVISYNTILKIKQGYQREFSSTVIDIKGEHRLDRVVFSQKYVSKPT